MASSLPIISIRTAVAVACCQSTTSLNGRRSRLLAKQPYAIALKSGEPFALAAIWENWQKPGTEEWVRSFAVITCPANEMIAEIHDRMPVILPPHAYDRWLSSIEPDPRDLLVPFPAELMVMWPISTRVNKPIKSR